MNSEAKFVSSVMDARLKKVKRERDAYKKQRDELINDMVETKRKAKAFDEIDDLIVNGTLKDREPNAIFQNICHVIINLKERCSDVEI
ncbi:hypothetical protein K4R75_00460 [Staphylococcus epidermidis]|jgi:hypothetical protein|uniref:hypothetical protein n=1 Tax=Staphylococcus epidermidis TaxID=1282 RepID=UPI00026C1DD9|nr:hypothetical protein [Staphylococcus epidermidis]MDU5817446.1 hypothetical protein [Staphylococcus sp.]DAZ07147.1 MAG TPA: Protein of unknown function (DUF1024) [Caudoviricetes sp.]EJE09049.1 hypothetical protein HMPREF9982_03078 [Staphylococcus epidermidis NIHLM021]MCG1653403.1 hypothetical protein [Staphylococcus epidermidis]MCG1660216.1 hypothetical protein [Staphylococcus epidermidis]